MIDMSLWNCIKIHSSVSFFWENIWTAKKRCEWTAEGNSFSHLENCRKFKISWELKNNILDKNWDTGGLNYLFWDRQLPELMIFFPTILR